MVVDDGDESEGGGDISFYGINNENDALRVSLTSVIGVAWQQINYSNIYKERPAIDELQRKITRFVVLFCSSLKFRKFWGNRNC